MANGNSETRVVTGYSTVVSCNHPQFEFLLDMSNLIEIKSLIFQKNSKIILYLNLNLADLSHFVI